MTGKVGKRPRVKDDELLRLVGACRNMGELLEATGYWDRRSLTKRLRSLGIPPGQPGRPRRQEVV